MRINTTMKYHRILTGIAKINNPNNGREQGGLTPWSGKHKLEEFGIIW